MHVAPLPQQQSRRPSATRRFLRLLMVLAILAGLAAISSGQSLPAGIPGLGFLRTGAGLTQSAALVGLARLGEEPAITPQPVDGALPLCETVSTYEEAALRDGLALMRGTEEGLRLYRLLAENGVCIGTDDLPYNSAYATSRWSPRDGWADSEIVIDREFVSQLYPDVLAAVLVHEAIHIERAISGTACYYGDACTTLANGVRLEEEVIAHAAETEWWIAAFGPDGKEFAFANDRAVNALTGAYRQGQAVFESYVREGRSSSREGEGI